MSTEEGTGIVHLAPYGEDDMMVARRDGLPVEQMIDATGHVVETAGHFAEMWFKDADEHIVEDMQRSRRPLPQRALRALISALLALRHSTHVLRVPRLVHPNLAAAANNSLQATRTSTGSRPPSSMGASGTGSPTTLTGA